ncbi:MAG: ribosome recycling factor [Flavobacteriales bacterium]|nr:ribosome recycling factor [Flavobacteriales bacterium]
MSEEVTMALDEAKEQMQGSINHLEVELGKIRAGKAHPSMLDSVKLDYYGTITPLKQVANVSTPDARTITVQPWEKSMLDAITTAIINSNLGLNPQNNGELIIINVPALTEERRRELSKRVRAEGENAKVSIRNARKDANDFIKSAEKDGLSEDMAKTAEGQVQDITNSFTKKIDDICDAKEADIMTV